VHPETRVRFAVETARAVLDGRLDAAEGAVAVEVQVDQLVPLLRSDRDAVTRSEAESVATLLRMLAEQVNDRSRGVDPRDAEAHLALAAALGTLAQPLR
jgi:hypothetical protein